MLHIGKTQVNLGMPNAKVLYFGETKMGPIIGESGEPTPGGTILHQYDRVDNKATVAGFWTDGNGQRYAVCVVDAQYRSWGQMWSESDEDTLLPNYSSSSEALASGESGTYNTDTILNNYTATDYEAFNVARNACTVTVDNKTFTSCLPNLKELDMLYQDRNTLDTYDPTLSSYSQNSLSSWNIGGNSYYICWSSTEAKLNAGWSLESGSLKKYTKYYAFGVIPVIEIPVDENGRVM